MCGIAGILSPNGIRSDYLVAMSSALRHRGPDGFGYMVYGRREGIQVVYNYNLSEQGLTNRIVGFAHRRLAIIDLSENGLQPMRDQSGSCCITYNGEIYNYTELRKALEDLGYRFQTSGDTEVILKAYDAWGVDCLKRFNGMWAFALLDARQECVIFSRDRFGIKPLFLSIENNSLYFSSEIKGLLAIPAVRKEPNERTVAKYLLTGLTDDTEETFFEGIHQFPPGHWGRVSLTEHSVDVKLERYWSIGDGSYGGCEEDAVEMFRELFLDSVRIHHQSDVPVGSCLSGGLDSSSIVCGSDWLRKVRQVPNLSHFAFGYSPPEREYSEIQYMEEVARATCIELKHVEVTENEFLFAIPQIIQNQDEPFGSASIAAQWFVMREARRNGMTVMLDGQGADEILGGYHTYFSTIALNLLARKNIIEYCKLRLQYEKEIGKFPLTYPIISLGMLRGLLPSYILYTLRPLIRLVRGGKSRQSLLGEQNWLSAALGKLYSNGVRPQTNVRSLNEELRIQLESASLPALLRYEDRNSMFHSIEARVPFLDYRLVEFVFSLPERMKIRGITTKYILRESMKGLLPEKIRTRKDKIGFRASPGFTFAIIRDQARTLMESQTSYEKNWFDEKGTCEMFSCNERSANVEFAIWRIVNLKVWLRQHWGKG